MNDLITIVGVADNKGIVEIAELRKPSVMTHYFERTKKNPGYVLFQCKLSSSQVDIIRELNERPGHDVAVLKAIVQFSKEGVDVDKSRKTLWDLILQKNDIRRGEVLADG